MNLCRRNSTEFDESLQEELQIEDKMLLVERWIRAALRAAKNQQALRCYHQHHVRPRSLAVGDLMLRRKLS